MTDAAPSFTVRSRAREKLGAPTPFALGELGTAELAAIIRIASITSTASDVAEAAEEIFAQIATFVPYDSICLSVWNPLTRRHSTLSPGYAEAVIDVIDSFWVPNDEILALTRKGERRPARWRDAPGYIDSRSAQEYLLPNGRHEGMGASLFDARARYTGMLCMDCESATVPSDAAREAVAAVQPMLAGFVDAMRGPQWLTRALAPGHHAAMIARSGQVLPIPGREPGPLLTTGSLLVRAVIETFALEGRPPFRFWWQDGSGAWQRVRATAVPGGVLAVTATGTLPYELSKRELDVLTVLAEGASNAEIARRLVLAERTVANHVASVLAKLDVPSRAGAVRRVLTEGLLRRPTPGARDRSAG